MYTIYEGVLTPVPLAPSGQLMVPRQVMYLNIYNMSPHRIAITLSSGQQDWYFPPNSLAEGIYLGKQSGRDLNISAKQQTNIFVQIKQIYYLSTLANDSGVLAILGFEEGELWQGKRPIVTGSVIPSTGANVAGSLINVGNPAGTNIITASAGVTDGSVIMDNIGQRTINIDNFGSALAYEQVVAGNISTRAAITYGIVSDPLATLLYGRLRSTDECDAGISTTSVAFQGTNPATQTNDWIPLNLIDQVTSAITWRLIKKSHANGDALQVVDLTNNKIILAFLPNATGLTFAGPMILRSTTQETGAAGFFGKAVAASDVWGYRVNFKSQMTNIPTSITLSGTATNCTAAASNIDKQGFDFKLTATALGVFSWTGTYTTVGN